MDILDLLWELQKHDNNLKEISYKVQELGNGKDIKIITGKMNRTEFRLTDLEFRLKEIEKKLNKNNFTLKDLDFKLNETEKELYDGNINDLKQLGYLDRERKVLREKVDEKEIEILSQMEEMEELKKEFIEIEDDFKNLKIQYIELIEQHKELIIKLKETAEKEIKDKEGIIPQISEKILNKYNQLIKLKGNAVVEVIDCKCTGCNVLLPVLVVDKLKFNNEIVYCENCGRILYYKRL